MYETFSLIRALNGHNTLKSGLGPILGDLIADASIYRLLLFQIPDHISPNPVFQYSILVLSTKPEFLDPQLHHHVVVGA